MKEIRGDAKSIRELLGGAKYSIDYYQREYKWQTKQVAELIDDLAAKFLESHEPGDERSAVADYGHYFLGSIIISDKDGQKFIIDGQQRLTTLTLLLIYLHHQLDDAEQKGADRRPHLLAEVWQALLQSRRSRAHRLHGGALQGRRLPGATASRSRSPTSSAAITDIEDVCSRGAQGAALPYFVDWLIENVHLVEITAYSDDDAYTIFETMNDRGLSLTPADMLKGYLLANITDATSATRASQRLEGAVSGAGRPRQGRGCRRDQVLAAQPVRREHSRAQARRAAAGLRPHRHRVSPLGPRPRRALGSDDQRDVRPLHRATTSPSTADGTSVFVARPRRSTPRP